MTFDYTIHYLSMPIKVKEAVTRNEDGSYTIFINSKISSDAQLHAFEHAITHILQDDFNKDNVQDIEVDAHINTVHIVDNFRVNKED